MDQITKAFQFAYKAHHGQKRKGTEVPYMVHLMDVVSILLKNNAPDEVVVAGFLHDTVEDTNITLDEIREKFGDKVAELVDAASEPEELVNGDKKKNWKVRKEHTISFMNKAGKEKKLLSCADKLANARDMLRDQRIHGDEIWKRFHGNKENQRWYYWSMMESFREGESIEDTSAYKEYHKTLHQLFDDL